MSEFNTVGVIELSMDEMQQVEGGLGFLIISLLPSVGMGYGVTKSIMDMGSGGGEALPGLGRFLMGTTAIATAAGARPQ